MFLLLFSGVLGAGCAIAPPPGGVAPAAGAAEAVAADADLYTSEAIITALTLIGTPYAPGGISPDAGFDCSGLVTYVFARSTEARLPRSTFDLARVGATVAPADLRPGDLVFYNTQQRPFSHVGIYLGESRFVHAPSSGGAVRIEDMRVGYWARRFDGARRLSF
jgi:cell wall-associated NlpC family hydrolase